VLLRSRLGQKERWSRQLEAQVKDRTGQLEASQAVLAQQARQLASCNGRLEEAVRERTRELALKNGELMTSEEALRASNEALTALNEELHTSHAQLGAAKAAVERLSDEALRVSEQQYKDLAGSLTLPVVVYDKDLRYQYVNRAVEEINGMPATELIGKTGREVFGETFAPRESTCRQVMASGKPVVYRESPVRNGKRYHWEIGVYPTGRGGTLVLNHDVTELVEARQHLQAQQEERQASYAALQSSEGRLRKVLDSMFIFAGLFSTDGRLLYANAAPLKAVGVEPDEVLGKPFASTRWFHSAEERRKLRENLARAARGETVRYDSSTLDKDGNMLYLDITLGPLCNEQGEVVQIIGSGVDVTARKEAKRKLQESNDRYQALVINFPNGTVFLVDREMRYQVVGGAGLAEVGLSEQMMLGKTPLELKRHTLLVVDDEPDHLKLFRLALKGHPRIEEVETLAEGGQALRYLQSCRVGGNPARPFPSLLFLDLNMPGMNGLQVLARIRAEEVVKRIPVILFTTSREEKDVAASDALGANSFIQKPVDYDVFCNQLEGIIDYWLGVNELPF
jgi:PAS domain S-box-containing protein